MDKVNEFETAEYKYTSNVHQRFSPEANIHYECSSVDDLLKDLSKLSEMIAHHREHQYPRLKVLCDYYEGNNATILRGKRRREEHLADNRATHAFAEYVSGFIQGYLVGIPLKTTHNDDVINDKLMEINRNNDADEHNSELVLDQSIYGRAYELVYRNKRDEVRFTTLSVTETFVIYDETVEREPIAAVRYFEKKFTDKTLVFVYTDSKVIEYELGNDDSLKFIKEQEHSFKGVPVVEYTNNNRRMGDFERVLSLIDLYDESQSDTANYMTDLNDAMLKIVGNLEIDVKQAKEMKEHNILMLQTEPNSEGRSNQADADYIYKKYDVAGTEAYKTRVADNIHMFTHTPNMTDEKFGGNQSGESMKYKLFGLEQKRATKERLFKKSLRDRYRLINNILSVASEGSFDVNEITITFTPNLPKSIKDEIEAFVKLGGDLSDETKLSILSIVDNPQEELEKMEKENPRTNLHDYVFPNTEVIEKEVIEDEE